LGAVMLIGFQFRRNPNAANAATEADLTPRRQDAKRHQKLAGDNVPGEQAARNHVLKGRWRTNGHFRRPAGTDFVWGVDPGTLCRANFRLSRRDESRQTPTPAADVKQ
jgi:hypothetical protein